ncbi:MAG: DUF3169 family protein [Lachnoclostridium sp.]
MHYQGLFYSYLLLAEPYWEQVRFIFLTDWTVVSVLLISIVMTRLQTMILPLLLCITLISVLTGELTLKKLKRICRQILQTEDESCNIWEYEEKTSALGMNMNILSQVLCVIILSLGYSMKYIETTNSSHFLFACLFFILCYAYDGF